MFPVSPFKTQCAQIDIVIFMRTFLFKMKKFQPAGQIFYLETSSIYFCLSLFACEDSLLYWTADTPSKRLSAYLICSAEFSLKVSL